MHRPFGRVVPVLSVLVLCVTSVGPADAALPRAATATSTCAPAAPDSSAAPSSPAATPRAASSTIGATGGGDPYYPRQGNGGYDVSHYRVWLNYTPRGQQIRGAVLITATARQKLARFSLDLRPNMRPTLVLVNKRDAGHSQPARLKQELLITPKSALLAGHTFTVFIRYAGAGQAVTDPGGSPDGWIATNDGGFVANEPQGTPSWLPVNNTPRDKATYTMSISVPKQLAAISNGHFAGRVLHGSRAVFTYQMTRPISSYLVTATIGRFSLHTGTTSRGVKYLIAIDPSQLRYSKPVLTDLPKMIDYFSSVYGRYPFPQSGAIVDNAPDVGYALETATRPLFPFAPSPLTLAHELAHQWYGDTVTLARWRDIWLNEGFAQFSEWLWDQHTGGTTLRAHLKNLLAYRAGNEVWNPPPGNPGAAGKIFADSVYQRGAGTLEALREKIGNRTFFAIMRGWLAKHRYGNATVQQFTAYAAAVAHRNLTSFFNVWLYRRGKP